MLFYAYFNVLKKRNIRRSRNGTKSTGEVIFWKKTHLMDLDPMSEDMGAAHEGGGAPPRVRPLPRGAPVAPLTCFFCLYNSIYPKTSRKHNRSGVPPTEAFVATKNQSRPIPAPCRRGEPSPVAIFIIPVLSMTRRE